VNIYVGNLSYETTGDGLRAAFEVHGTVSAATVITDRDTGRPRGFGFVEMPDDAQAKAAIEALNGKDLDGRTLNVSQAREKQDRPRGHGGDDRPRGRSGEGRPAGRDGDDRSRGRGGRDDHSRGRDRGNRW